MEATRMGKYEIISRQFSSLKAHEYKAENGFVWCVYKYYFMCLSSWQAGFLGLAKLYFFWLFSSNLLKLQNCMPLNQTYYLLFWTVMVNYHMKITASLFPLFPKSLA